MDDSKTGNLVSQIDSIVRQVEGSIYLRAYIEKFGLWVRVFDDPRGLPVEKGIIKIPLVNASNSPLFAKLENGLLAIALALSRGDPRAAAVIDALSGAGSLAIDKWITKGLVLRDGLKLTEEDLKTYDETGGFYYDKILHVILDDSLTPSNPLPVGVRLEIARSNLSIVPAGPGRPPKSLATTFGANKISTDVQGGVDLALDGAFDLNGKYGALRVFIRGDLANLVLQGSGLSVGTRKLNLAELVLSFAYAGQKQTLRVNLANLLLNKFKFKLGG